MFIPDAECPRCGAGVQAVPSGYDFDGLPSEDKPELRYCANGHYCGLYFATEGMLFAPEAEVGRVPTMEYIIQSGRVYVAALQLKYNLMSTMSRIREIFEKARVEYDPANVVVLW